MPGITIAIGFNYESAQGGGITLLPSSFTVAQWTVADLATGGDVRFTISSLPHTGNEPLTDIEYRIGAGAAVSSGLADVGSFDVTGLTDDVQISVQIRGVTVNGAGPWSDTKTVTPTGLILDTYSRGAVFSLRKLVSDYTGNCVRIRRSSDSTEQNFGFVSNVVDTAGIATFIGGGSGFVVTWYDQSGNGLDITQATAAAQPLYVASGINSKPTVRFDGTDDVLTRASVPIATICGANQGTILFAQNQNGAETDNTTVYWQAAAGNRLVVHATFSDVIYYDFGSTATGRVSVAQPSGWDNAAHITELYRATNGAQAIIVDGAELASASVTGGPSGTNTLEIGAAVVSAAFFRGDLSELILFPTDIGSTARGTIRANMGSFYGVTI